MNYDEEELKLLRALSFQNSDVWDAVITIIQNNVDFELSQAIGVMENENQRSHACGRVDGMLDLKNKLVEFQRAAHELKFNGKL
jgi:hypothetical protein